jgi:hypothetical protein
MKGADIMKTMVFKTRKTVLMSIIAVATLLSGCVKMSEIVRDESIGMNGSFEHTKSDVPVNWLIYMPTTIPTGDYELIVDTTESKDGKQSLLFLVHECSSVGGWHSPGLSNEYNAAPGETYKVSFWVKNEGSEFCVKIGGVSAFEGEYDTVVESGEPLPDWTLFEHDYKMPSEEKFNRIRFEMNVLQPGSFRIDDVKIEGINGESVTPTAR